MSQTEAAIRSAGALAVLVAASTLMGFAAVSEERADVVLVLHAIMQLGCAAVLLSTAHGAVAALARRATEGARRTALAASGYMRCLGFAGIVLYALYVSRDIGTRQGATTLPDTVKGFLLFLLFLAGVWAVYLSTVRSQGGPPAAAVAAVEVEGDPDGGDVNPAAPRPARVVVDSKVWRFAADSTSVFVQL